MYKKIAIATQNQSKIKELRFLFSQYGIETISAFELGQKEDPIENGNTFFENALIKAKALRKYTELPIIADDSGVCIKILNNQPGIYSARWTIENDERSPEIGIQKIYNEISYKLPKESKINNKKFSAKFICSLVMLVDKIPQEFEGNLEGNIIFPPKGNSGFGYDSIFIPNGYSKTLAQISFKEKQKISHRKKALEKLIKYILT